MCKVCLLVWAVFGLASCVTNKKIQYLQMDDVNAREVKLDSVVRYYKSAVGEYRLQPNDVLSVQVESLTQPEFNFFPGDQDNNLRNLSESGAALVGKMVDEKGEIDLQVAGKIKVRDKTISEVQNHIQQIANRYVKDPVVKVRLLNFRFTILGEVIREGTINSFNNRVTIPEAIGLAGGLTDLADRSKVKLIRQRNDISQVLYVDLLKEQFLESPYYEVHQQDVLIVPPLKQRPFKTNFGTNFGIVLSAVSTLLLALNIFRVR